MALGWSAAVVLYLVAKPPPEDPLGYDRLSNKRYILELERLGGKGNVMTAELMDDFFSLWQGENLAYTIAFLTLLGAGVFWYIATFPEPATSPGAPASAPKPESVPPKVPPA